ncbi:hypothetical protein MMC22_001517 [Lobaria immixta]|nr:hypothetical protein [Lobaria immixta]
MKAFSTILLAMAAGRAFGTAIPDPYRAEITIETGDAEPNRPAAYDGHVRMPGTESVTRVPKVFDAEDPYEEAYWLDRLEPVLLHLAELQALLRLHKSFAHNIVCMHLIREFSLYSFPSNAPMPVLLDHNIDDEIQHEFVPGVLVRKGRGRSRSMTLAGTETKLYTQPL